MKIKSQRDFGSGLMFLVIGAAFTVGATSYSLGSSAKPGPGYFPLMLGVLLALLGAVVLFKSLSIETEGGDPIGPIAWRPLLVIVLAIVAFAVALPRLGLIVSVPLLITVVSLAGDDFRWKSVVAMSAALALGSWAIFVWGLQLTLPLWPQARLLALLG